MPNDTQPIFLAADYDVSGLSMVVLEDFHRHW